jgi:hypothetical protein
LYCESRGFSSPEEFYNFCDDLFWTNLEVQSVRSINSLIRDSELKIKNTQPYSEQVKKSTLFSIGYIMFGLAFGLRYLIYMSIWSIKNIQG